MIILSIILIVIGLLVPQVRILAVIGAVILVVALLLMVFSHGYAYY